MCKTVYLNDVNSFTPLINAFKALHDIFYFINGDFNIDIDLSPTLSSDDILFRELFKATFNAINKGLNNDAIVFDLITNIISKI